MNLYLGKLNKKAIAAVDGDAQHDVEHNVKYEITHITCICPHTTSRHCSEFLDALDKCKFPSTTYFEPAEVRSCGN